MLGLAVGLLTGCGQVGSDDAASTIVDQLSGQQVSYIRCDGADDDGTVRCEAKVNGTVKQYVIDDSGQLDLIPASVPSGAPPDHHPKKLKPSERCSASNLTACRPTSACLMEFGINPDDPNGWNQPHGWIACLKKYGESEAIIDQYRR